MTIRIIDTRIGIRDLTDWGRGYQVVGEGGTPLAGTGAMLNAAGIR